MSDSSIILLTIGIILLEEYLQHYQGDEKKDSKKDINSKKFKKKKNNIQVLGVDIIDQRLFKKRSICSICFIDFGYFKWQYHCYLCACSVCWECSINYINSKKSCDVCFYKFSNIQREISKQKILIQMEETSKIFIKKQKQLQRMNLKAIQLMPTDQDNQKKSVIFQQNLSNLQKKLAQMKLKHQILLKQLSKQNQY